MERVDRKEGIGHFLIRLIVGMVVLGITAFLTPGFVISSWSSLLLAAVVLALLDWLLNRITGINAAPFGRGLLGFVLAAAIIYTTNFIVPGYTVTILGAIIAAIIYGVVDAIIPGRAM